MLFNHVYLPIIYVSLRLFYFNQRFCRRSTLQQMGYYASIRHGRGVYCPRARSWSRCY